MNIRNFFLNFFVYFFFVFVSVSLVSFLYSYFLKGVCYVNFKVSAALAFVFGIALSFMAGVKRG